MDLQEILVVVVSIAWKEGEGGNKYKTPQVFIYFEQYRASCQYSILEVSRHAYFVVSPFLDIENLYFASQEGHNNQLLRTRFTLKYLQVYSPPFKKFMCSLSLRTRWTHSKGERTDTHITPPSLFRLCKQTLCDLTTH